MINIYTDGACLKSNPTNKIGWGVVFGSQEFMGSMTSKDKDLTNNIAEYEGLYLALERILLEEHEKQFTIHSDSLMCVDQLNGQKKINKGSYEPYAIVCKGLLETLKKDYKIKIMWIPREENAHADALSKKALLI